MDYKIASYSNNHKFWRYKWFVTAHDIVIAQENINRETESTFQPWTMTCLSAQVLLEH